MEYITWFVLGFILIYILYYFLFIMKSRRGKKVPSEAQLLIVQYKLDTKKFSYRKFLKVVGVISSVDISLVATIVGNVDGVVWQVLFGFVIVIPVVVVSYLLLGKYYQNKQLKDNSKELLKEKKYLDKKDAKEKAKMEKKKGKRKNDKYSKNRS